MANNYLKKYSKSLVIREMPSKTTIKYHFIPTRLAKINKTNKTNISEDMEQLEHSSLLVRL